MFDILKDVLAIIGALAILLGPAIRAWLKLAAQGAVAESPAHIDLAARMRAVENWQSSHAEDVKLIPKLAAILERMEKSLERLLERLES